MRYINKSFILVLGILVLNNRYVTAQVYQIKDMTFPVTIDGVKKKRGDYLYHTDSITWSNRGDERVKVIDEKGDYFDITKKGYVKIKAKSIGDFIIYEKTLKTKGITSTGVVEKQSNNHIDSIDCKNTSIQQVLMDAIDSLAIHNIDDRYCIVFKDRKCGLYDVAKEMNMTLIEYDYLTYLFRKQENGKYYTFFIWEKEDKGGVVRIDEDRNCYVVITFP